MKSNKSLIATGLLFLAMAVTISTILWSDVTSPVKIAMYAFGFSTGIMVGALIARRSQSA